MKAAGRSNLWVRRTLGVREKTRHRRGLERGLGELLGRKGPGVARENNPRGGARGRDRVGGEARMRAAPLSKRRSRSRVRNDGSTPGLLCLAARLCKSRVVVKRACGAAARAFRRKV